jgi:hypothetical protein
MKNNNKYVLLANLLLVCFVLFSIGCGKKGPPIASRQQMPESVIDLKGKVDADTLTLTWIVPENSSHLTGFIVYRSKLAVSKPECKTCPVLFERVIDIPIMEKDPADMENKTMTHSEVLERGFRYIYKVNPYMKGGRIGKDSKYFVYSFESGQNSDTE